MSKLVSIAMQNTSGQPSAAQQAAFGAADKVLAQAQTADTTVVATPTETIAEQVPQAVAEVAPTGSPEALQRVAESAQQGEILTTAQQEGVLQPGVFAEASPEQAQAQYIGQLQQERTRTPEQTFDWEQGVITLPMKARTNDNTVSKITEDISRTESAFRGDQAAVPRTTPETLPAMNALKKLGLAEEAPSGRGVTAGSLQPRQGVGGAAYLAFIAGLAAIERDKESGKLVGKDIPQAGQTAETAISEGAVGTGAAAYTNRFSFVEKIADSFEKLTAQPKNIDQQTGEASRLGFQSQLSKEERLSLGNLIVQTMAETGMMTQDDADADTNAYVYERKAGTGTGREYEYRLNKAGMEQLNRLAPVLEQLIPSLSRPVSQTPLPDGGFVGEAALGQKQITRTPLPGKPSETMLQAMDVMGRMPNMISDHKSSMVEMMLTDIETRNKQIEDGAKQQVQFEERKAQLPPSKERNDEQKAAFRQLVDEYIAARDALAAEHESPFAELFGQDVKTLKKMAAASEMGARKTRKVWWDGDKWMREGTNYTTGKKEVKELDSSNSARLSELYPDPTPDAKMEVELRYLQRTMDQGSQFHRPFAEEVVGGEMEKAKRTLQDALEQKQKGVFYHGVTAIGNSSRLMVTSTQLNYQANKLARFMTDNPRPSQLTKGGNKDAAFRYLAARAMLDGADLLTPQALKDKFNSSTVQNEINPIARKVYQATQAKDPEALGAAIKEAMASDLIADEWEGNGEWGFPVDALHEWGKYLEAPEGAQVSTRLKAEVDGINNGSSIQGMQFGDQGIMERAGIIYDEASGEVLTSGQNMRGYIFSKMVEPDGEGAMMGIRDVPKKHANALGGTQGMMELLNTVASKDKIKALVKIPLMTTIYGKPFDMHGDHARKFVTDNWESLGLSEEQIKPAIAMFTKVISNGLLDGLNTALVHQSVIKYTAGWLFNAMDEIPQIRGANGYIIQAGGHRYLGDTGDAQKDLTMLTLSRLNPEGQKVKEGTRTRKSEIGIRRTIPSATAAKKERGQEGKIGSITRNQLAVNGTHNIDATIAQLTMIRARKQLGPTFWGQQVFDAFIGDLDSLEPLLDIGNKTFAQVNSTYNMLEAEYDAFRESLARFKKKADKAQELGEKWDVGVEGQYRGVYQLLKSFLGTDSAWEDGGKAQQFFGKYGITRGKKDLEMDTTEFNPHQVVDMIKFIEQNFLGDIDKTLGVNVHDAFRKSIADTNARRKQFRKELLRRRKGIRQYN